MVSQLVYGLQNWKIFRIHVTFGAHALLFGLMLSKWRRPSGHVLHSWNHDSTSLAQKSSDGRFVWDQSHFPSMVVRWRNLVGKCLNISELGSYGECWYTMPAQIWTIKMGHSTSCYSLINQETPSSFYIYHSVISHISTSVPRHEAFNLHFCYLFDSVCLCSSRPG